MRISLDTASGWVVAKSSATAPPSDAPTSTTGLPSSSCSQKARRCCRTIAQGVTSPPPFWYSAGSASAARCSRALSGKRSVHPPEYQSRATQSIPASSSGRITRRHSRQEKSAP
eukprot:scaffold99941_cov61-Phaeocystis_antarctica.AAC.5